jgi:hypothetical protein
MREPTERRGERVRVVDRNDEARPAVLDEASSRDFGSRKRSRRVLILLEISASHVTPILSMTT